MRYKEPKQWTNMFDATPATPNALDEKIESGVADQAPNLLQQSTLNNTLVASNQGFSQLANQRNKAMSSNSNLTQA